MNEEGMLFLKVLLDKTAPSLKEKMEAFLPLQINDQLYSLSLPEADVLQGIESSEKRVSEIHGSWFSEALSESKAFDQHVLFSLLSSVQTSHLNLQKKRTPFTRKIARQFFSQKLLKLVETENPLPIEFLPASSFNILFTYSFQQLEEFISQLGMYDLSLEVRKIIDPQVLKRLDKVLTPLQRKWLKYLLDKKKPLTFSPSHFDEWKGGEKELQEALTKKSLYRLARALEGEHPDLIIHLAHRLEKSKGVMLRRFKLKKDPSKNEIFKSQVLELMNFIKGVHT